MKKMKLRLTTEDLRVEAFPTSEKREMPRATVRAYASSLGGDCPSESWSGPVNCLCCNPSEEMTQCCHTDPISC
jgi:hypothetical protein